MANYGAYSGIGTCNGINLQQVTPTANCPGKGTAELTLSPSGLIIATLTCSSFEITTPSTFPCRSIYEFGKLLTPPSKYSIISSEMWNDIRNDLFLAYSIYKYINNYINGLNLENIKS